MVPKKKKNRKAEKKLDFEAWFCAKIYCIWRKKNVVHNWFILRCWCLVVGFIINSSSKESLTIVQIKYPSDLEDVRNKVPLWKCVFLLFGYMKAEILKYFYLFIIGYWQSPNLCHILPSTKSFSYYVFPTRMFSGPIARISLETFKKKFSTLSLEENEEVPWCFPTSSQIFWH